MRPLDQLRTRLSPRELYTLRRVHLEAQEKALVAQRAQQRLQRLILELERRYNLLSRGATLDLATGTIHIPEGEEQGTRSTEHGGATPAPRSFNPVSIKREDGREPVPDAGKATPGPA